MYRDTFYDSWIVNVGFVVNPRGNNRRFLIFNPVFRMYSEVDNFVNRVETGNNLDTERNRANGHG